MKLKILKNMIDQAAAVAGDDDVDVEVWFENEPYDIASVGQFHFVPDVVITLKKLGDEEEEQVG